MQEWLGIPDEEAFYRTEAVAVQILADDLHAQGMRTQWQSVGMASGISHYYFVPELFGRQTPFVDSDGQRVSAESLEQIILYGLLPQSKVSPLQAILAINTFVSQFSLALEEMSLLFSDFWTTDDERQALARFCDAMKLLGYEWQPVKTATRQLVDDEDDVEADGADQTEIDGLVEEGDYNKLAVRLQRESVNFRVSLAKEAQGPLLQALCLDPQARVVIAVLTSPFLSLQHARLIAEHHHTSQGLSALFRNASFIRDDGVRRRLLRNRTTSEQQLGRLLGAADLVKLYNYSMSSEIPPRARLVAGRLLKTRYLGASPIDRVRLIMRTVGRCLDRLRGLGVRLDHPTNAILMQETQFSSALFAKLKSFPGVSQRLVSHMQRNLIK